MLRKSVEQLNNEHGGKDPHITNVLYTNGVLEVNYPFGITIVENGKPWKIINTQCGKSCDFWQNESYDEDSVKAAKKQVTNVIVEWSKE